MLLTITPQCIFLLQVPAVLWAPKQWGSHGEETRGPQEPDPGGGDRKSIQGEWYTFFIIKYCMYTFYTGTVIFCISLHNEGWFLVINVQVLKLEKCAVQLEQCQLVRYNEKSGILEKLFDEPKVRERVVCVCVWTWNHQSLTSFPCLNPVFCHLYIASSFAHEIMYQVIPASLYCKQQKKAAFMCKHLGMRLIKTFSPAMNGCSLH